MRFGHRGGSSPSAYVLAEIPRPLETDGVFAGGEDYQTRIGFYRVDLQAPLAGTPVCPVQDLPLAAGRPRNTDDRKSATCYQNCL